MPRVPVTLQCNFTAAAGLAEPKPVYSALSQKERSMKKEFLCCSILHMHQREGYDCLVVVYGLIFRSVCVVFGGPGERVGYLEAQQAC
jgi:hypothetical protein